MRCSLGTLASSPSVTCSPLWASRAATAASCREGARTTIPTTGSSVLTWASSCTSRTLAATEVTSSVDITHEPTTNSKAAQVARATARSCQRGIGRTRLGNPQHGVDRRGGRRARGRRGGAVERFRAGEAGAHVLAQLVGVVGQQQQVERRHRACVDAGVAHGQPVGDDRGARRHRLQAGHPAGGVHQHVGRRQHVGHAVGEAVDVDPIVAGEVAPQAVGEVLVAPRQAHDCGDLGQLRELAHRSGDVANTPAAARYDHHAPLLGQGERAPRVGGRPRLQELSRDQRADELDAVAAGDRLHRRHRLVVHHQVHVDSGLGPEEQPGQVGDRGNRRTRHGSRSSQAREHDGDGRVGGHDHVRFVFGDLARQRA